MNDSIKVCVRIRPLNEKEKSRNSVCIWKTASNNTIYHHPLNPSIINSGSGGSGGSGHNNSLSSSSSSGSLSSLIQHQQQQNNNNSINSINSNNNTNNSNNNMDMSNNNNGGSGSSSSGNGIPTSYTFDHVYDQQSSTELIYSDMCKHIVMASVRGYNGTIFAYGQTSSGKTFT